MGARMDKWSLLLTMVFSLSLRLEVILAQQDPTHSGGPLMPEQAAYNVSFYDIELKVDSFNKSIEGKVIVQATVVHPTRWFVLNLDTLLEVSAVQCITDDGELRQLDFHRKKGNVWIDLTRTIQPGNQLKIAVGYSGQPRSQSMNGVIWSRTLAGYPWVGVWCEEMGADIWWPCKDHPSDRADSISLQLTVPEPLKAVANGTLREVKENNNGTRTYHWFESQPINNYSVTINIAPYREIKRMYRSINNDEFPVIFWVLPEKEKKAKTYFSEIIKIVSHLESLLGPYPFRSEKLGFVETPYMGMEHQTIIAYGGNFRYDAMAGIDWGFDALIQHELAHEWFANMLTPLDWRDLWLNESLATYMQILYAEEFLGEEKVQDLLSIFYSRMENEQPIVPEKGSEFSEVYGPDIYYKGALILNTLRFLIGDKRFKSLLRKWAYPDPTIEKMTNGSQCRFVTTEDFLDLAEETAGVELDWFFSAYLFQPQLPHLISRIKDDILELKWETVSQQNFPFPVEVKIGRNVERISMNQELSRIQLENSRDVQIDPHNRVLKKLTHHP
jgi:aminopeptidase N